MNTTSSNSTEVKVITAVERRRRWAPIEKRAMVEETYEPGSTVSFVARKHDISPSQLFYWRRMMENGALEGIKTEERVVAESELKKAQDRNRRLEQLLGRKTEEVEILKEAVKIAREKKLISRAPLRGVDDFQ